VITWEQIKSRLFVKNEYGYEYRDPSAQLAPEELAFIEGQYGIKTEGVHRHCVNCQAAQYLKYRGYKTKTGREVNNFNVRCDYIQNKLPAASKRVVEELKKNGWEEAKAIKYVKAMYDPVAWAEVMLGYGEGYKDEIRDYQKEIVRCTAKRQVLRQGRRSGKALDVETPILTPQGWTRMGALEVGDYVFDEQGKPTQIIEVTDEMLHHVCYEVEFSDGSKIVADAEHYWDVENTHTRSVGQREKTAPASSLMTTEGLKLDFLTERKRPNYSIKNIAGPLEYAAREAPPLDPYMAGAWYSRRQASASKSVIVINSKDAEGMIAQFDPIYIDRIVKAGKQTNVHLKGVRELLEPLVCARENGIPDVYKYGSPEVRLRFIQGVLDRSAFSRGQIGGMVYSNSVKSIFYDFVEMLRAHGINVAISLKPARPEIGALEVPQFTLYTQKPIVTLERRKKLLQDNSVHSVRFSDRRFITSIKRVNSRPVRCIAVDSPSHLFLAGKNLIPTHNTFTIALKLIYTAFTRKIYGGLNPSTGKDNYRGPVIVIITPFQAQLKNVFEQMETLIKRSVDLTSRVATVSNGGLYVQTPFFRMELKDTDGEIGTKIYGFVTGVSAHQDGTAGGALRGASPDIVYVDEMDMVQEDILDKVVMPFLLTTDNVELYVSSTPIGKIGKFKQWALDSPDYKEFYYPSTVLPQWKVLKDEFEQNHSPDSEAFKAEFMADFVEGGYGVFRPQYIYAAKKNFTYEQPTLNNLAWWNQNLGLSSLSDVSIVVGIDWNKNAGSEFVITAYSPSVHRWVVIDAINVPASEYSAIRWKQEVLQLNYKWRPTAIYADKGYGHHIIEDLLFESEKMRNHGPKTEQEVQLARLSERLKAFDFKANVSFRSPVDRTEITKAGKDFLVENTIRVFEEGRIWFPETDNVLEEQLLHFVVLKRSATTNKPVYGSDSPRVEDHRLDAFMLSLGGLFLENSIYSGKIHEYSKPSFIKREDVFERERGVDISRPASLLEEWKKAHVPGSLSVLNIERDRPSRQLPKEEKSSRKQIESASGNIYQELYERAIISRSDYEPSIGQPSLEPSVAGRRGRHSINRRR